MKKLSGYWLFLHMTRDRLVANGELLPTDPLEGAVPTAEQLWAVSVSVLSVVVAGVCCANARCCCCRSSLMLSASRGSCRRKWVARRLNFAPYNDNTTSYRRRKAAARRRRLRFRSTPTGCAALMRRSSCEHSMSAIIRDMI